MKLQNKSGNNFSHTIMKKVKVDGQEVVKPVVYTIQAGGVADVPKEIANIWLKIKGIKEYVEAEDLAKVEATAKAELEAVKAELATAKEAEATAKAELEAVKAELNELKEANK